MLRSPYPLIPLTPCLHRGGGDPKTVYNMLCPLCSPLPPSPLAPTEGVGTYKGLLQHSECTCGGGSICRWWGHLTTICGNRTFSVPGGGDPKTSIEYASLPFAPLHSFAPFAPLRSLCPLCSLKPSKQYALLPFTPFCPLIPCPHRGGGNPKT